VTITLYQGDCLEIMQTLPEKSVDAIITDPPYGVNYADWDSDIPSQYFLDNCIRISRGIVLMFGAASMILEYARYNPEPDRVMIWSPSFTLSHTMSDGMAYRYHPIFLWNIPNQSTKIINWDVLYDNTECGNWWKHPATKPVSIMRKLVMAFGGDSILDPFMGSGTTGVACAQLGKSFTGCEIDPDYFKIAQRRIAEAQMQEPLFKEVIP
jgi:site-specific DNA-methyltransferase (adenine-specific)